MPAIEHFTHKFISSRNEELFETSTSSRQRHGSEEESHQHNIRKGSREIDNLGGEGRGRRGEREEGGGRREGRGGEREERGEGRRREGMGIHESRVNTSKQYPIPLFSPPHTHTHAHTHSRTHTHTHIHTHARTHARTYARTHPHTHTHTLALPDHLIPLNRQK